MWRKWIPLFVSLSMLISCQSVEQTNQSQDDVEVVYFPSDRFPETAAHIKRAIQKGESDLCTIDRKGADQRRKESLAEIPTKEGYDRDEWPMAMCKEGGKGADVEYVSPSDNRGAGSWVSNRLAEESNGTKVKFIVK